MALAAVLGWALSAGATKPNDQITVHTLTSDPGIAPPKLVLRLNSPMSSALTFTPSSRASSYVGGGLGLFITPELNIGADLQASSADNTFCFAVSPFLQYLPGMAQRKMSWFVEPSVAYAFAKSSDAAGAAVSASLWIGTHFFLTPQIGLFVGPAISNLFPRNSMDGTATREGATTKNVVMLSLKFGIVAYLSSLGQDLEAKLAGHFTAPPPPVKLAPMHPAIGTEPIVRRALDPIVEGLGVEPVAADSETAASKKGHPSELDAFASAQVR